MTNGNFDEQLIKNIEKLSVGGQLAIVLCASSFRFGGNWGFIRNTKADFKSQLEALKEERPNVTAKQLTNGALILCKENFLAYNVNQAIPNAIGTPFVQMAAKRREDEKARFVKFLKNVIAGKTSHVKSQSGYQELTLGLYSFNDTNAIRINGVEYPAYKLTLIEVLDYAIAAMKTVNKKVYVRAVDESGKELYDLAFNLAGNSKGQTAIYRGMEIADSDTGVFLSLRLV